MGDIADAMIEEYGREDYEFKSVDYGDEIEEGEDDEYPRD